VKSRRDDVAIERALRSVGAEIRYPDQPNLAAGVVASIETDHEPSAARFPRLRPALIVALTVVVAVSATLVFAPGVRRAIADWLGISGIRIETGEIPTPIESASPKALDLGPRVGLDEAQDEVDFPLRVPRSLGQPDRVHLDATAVGEIVFLVYEPRPGLPAAETTKEALLMAEFRAQVDAELIKKVAVPGTIVQPVRLGKRGYWIAGDPHALLFLDANGNVREDAIRLAGNVLVWEKDGVSYRIESALGKRQTLTIARSAMEPK
jgi:hypothetical protein